MVFAKGDPGIATLYEKLLVSEDLWAFGAQLRAKYEATKNLILPVAGHSQILEGDPYLRQRLTLKRIRDPSYSIKVGKHLSKDITISELDASKPADELVKLNPTSDYPPGLEDTHLDHEGHCCWTAEHWTAARAMFHEIQIYASRQNYGSQLLVFRCSEEYKLQSKNMLSCAERLRGKKM